MRAGWGSDFHKSDDEKSSTNENEQNNKEKQQGPSFWRLPTNQLQEVFDEIDTANKKAAEWAKKEKINKEKKEKI